MRYRIDGRIVVDGIKCKVCRKEFIGTPWTKICSPRCIRILRRRYDRRYRRTHDRSEYFRQYHLAHRDERIAKGKARWQANRDRYVAATKKRRDPLVIKVCELWHVGAAEARAMIERGEFPS